MKIKIEIACDNAAFEDDNCGREISRILKEAGANAHGYSQTDIEGLDGLILRDSNGNSVGSVEVIES